MHYITVDATFKVQNTTKHYNNYVNYKGDGSNLSPFESSLRLPGRVVLKINVIISKVFIFRGYLVYSEPVSLVFAN